ncbi:hypothetical protein TruAng_011841 [Truncatella angustata]|nr:hypothetical protein TruAng_011841 [Truncatella angustata]
MRGCATGDSPPSAARGSRRVLDEDDDKDKDKDKDKDMNCPIERRDPPKPVLKDYKRRTGTLDPKACTVACIASVEIEAQAALHMLDERHPGGSPWAEVTTMCSTQGACAGTASS